MRIRESLIVLGKLTTFRENLEHLIEETKGDVKTAKESKTESKKESKKEAKKAKETVTEEELDYELEAELAEETEQTPKSEKNAAVGNKTKPTDSETGTPTEIKNAPAEEDEMVELVSDLYDAEVKGGRMYSSEDTEVDLPNDSGSHMLSDTAEAEVKNALADKYYRKEIRLTDKTPSIMLSQKGVRDFPLFMNASHLRENVFTEAEALQKGLKVEPGINYHGLGDVLFLEVIDKLDDITEAYRGTKNAEKPERREDYFLLISKLKDKDGNIINVPIYINTKAKQNNVFIDVNKMATVFGKSNINHYIAQELRKGNIVRIKKRSPQTSEWTTPIVADYGMDASSANSIAESEEIVNTPEAISKNMYSAEDTDVILPSEDIEALNLENIRLKAENEALREQFHKTKIKKPKAEDIERVRRVFFSCNLLPLVIYLK